MPWIEDFLRSLINPDDIVVEPLQQPTDPTMSDWDITAQRRKRDEINRRRKLGLGEEKDHWITRAGEGDPVEKYMRDLSTGKESAPQDMEGEFWDKSGLSPDEVMVLGPQKVAERQALESGSNERDLREESRKKLLEAAGIKNQQQEFMQGTVPLIEDYDKRIAIGGQPGRGSAEDIMFRIRAEARAKGRGGDLMGNRPTEEDYRASVTPRGGSFITAEMTPEVQQRLDERDAWAADQPIRDAEFALTREQVERSPARASIAAQTLGDMKRNKVLGQQQALQESLVNKLADGSGKIPFEQAMQLEAAGVQIPYGARGMAPEQFDAKINEVITGSSADLERALEAQAMGAPPEAINMIVGFSSVVRDKAIRLDELVKSGKMKRDEAAKILEEIIASEAKATNAIKAFQLINPGMAVPQAVE
jgi:hypothetical protein